MARIKRIAPPKGFPLFGITPDSVKAYIEQSPLQKGDFMIIYSGQGGLHEYKLARVEDPALGRQKRVLLSKSGGWGGATFYRSGKNCFAPKGQTVMLPPIAALMEHLAEDVIVMLDAAPYARDLTA